MIVELREKEDSDEIQIWVSPNDSFEEPDLASLGEEVGTIFTEGDNKIVSITTDVTVDTLNKICNLINKSVVPEQQDCSHDYVRKGF